MGNNPYEIARKRTISDFGSYSPSKIDPIGVADLSHGWMIGQVIKWDKILTGRWDYWFKRASEFRKLDLLSEYCYEAQHDIPQLYFFEYDSKFPASKSFRYCLQNIKHPRIKDRRYNLAHFKYLVDWILFGLGDKNCLVLPEELPGCDGASDRLFQLFHPVHFLLHPCDYFGAFLEELGYFSPGSLLSQEMIRLTEVPEILNGGFSATVDFPFIDDLECKTGRILLELSNHCVILSGVNRDSLLSKCALINFYFYAPWACKHLCDDLASLYNPSTHEEISTFADTDEIQRIFRLTNKNEVLASFISGKDFYTMLMTGGRYPRENYKNIS